MSDIRPQTFPRKILEDDRKTRVEYFKGLRIAHPYIEDAKKRLLQAIEDADPDSLIFVFGPSGVGKSTLRISVMNALICNMLDELRFDLERIPVVGIELPSPPTGFFSWSESFRALLFAMNEPLVDYKLPVPKGQFQSSMLEANIPARKAPSELNLSGSERTSTSRYRHAYEQAMKYRRPVAALLDDAHYLNKVPAARLLDQLDFIKSIASAVKIPHVLFGTYELLALRNLSGQISRRSIDIHLPRYKADSQSDHAIFSSIVMTFALAMPVEKCPDLIEHVNYLMERSAGCVGILKTWLDQALIEALRSQEKTVTKEHLAKRSYSDEALAKMFMETAEGEFRLLEGGVQYSLQRERLGLIPKDEINRAARTEMAEGRTPKKSGNRRPGQRNPIRDAIGIK